MSPLIDLTGRTALITGASKGIGAATAALLASAGANLVLVSRHIDVEAATAHYAEAYGRDVLVMQADVANGEAIARLIDAAHARFGGVDILVNNAAANTSGLLLDTADADWMEALQVNLIGAARLCRLTAPGMLARRFGRIINIASNLGAFALRGKGVYSAAKAGLMQLTRSLALELAPDVLVNAVAVGAVNTDATAGPGGGPARDYEAIARAVVLGRLGTAEEIAGVVLFLASPLSSYITGQSIFVDGGASIWFAN